MSKKKIVPRLLKLGNSRKKLIWLGVLVLILGAVYLINTTEYSADTITSTSATGTNCSNTNSFSSCPAKNARLSVEVERPYQNSNLSAYPNGKDCAYVNIEAIKSDGTFLEKEPFTISKPNNVNISGPLDTGSGEVKWCVTSPNPIQARIIVKLKNYPRVQKSFRLNFNPNFRIRDLTDHNGFLYNIPIHFQAQIDPALVPNLKAKQLSFTYNRRINKWGFWTTRKREVIINLNCTQEGLCTGVIGGDNVNSHRVVRGSFSYTFIFLDSNGNKIRQTFSGQLKVN